MPSTTSSSVSAVFALKELHLAREALVKDRTAAKNRRKTLAAPLLKRQNAQRLDLIKRQIAAIETAIFEQVQADPDLAQRFAILTTFQASRPSQLLPCSSKCRSSAPWTPVRLQVSQVSRHRAAVGPLGRT
jgi:hypothetical protein